MKVGCRGEGFHRPGVVACLHNSPPTNKAWWNIFQLGGPWSCWLRGCPPEMLCLARKTEQFEMDPDFSDASSPHPICRAPGARQMLETHLSTCSDAFWHFPCLAEPLPPPWEKTVLSGVTIPGAHWRASWTIPSGSCNRRWTPVLGNYYSVHCCCAAPHPPPLTPLLIPRPSPSPLTKPSSVVGSGVQGLAVPCPLWGHPDYSPANFYVKWQTCFWLLLLFYSTCLEDGLRENTWYS